MRLVRDTRAFGAVGAPTLAVNLEATIVPADLTAPGVEAGVVPNDLEIAGNRVLVADVVDGRLASPHGTVTVRNSGTDWVEVFSIVDAETSVGYRFQDLEIADIAHRTLSSNSNLQAEL